MTNLKLEGAALITGASSGIGERYAQGLAQRGLDLILVARRGGELAVVADGIKAASGVRVETIVADLTRPHDLAVIEKRLRDDTRISLLVNNAGGATLSPSASITVEAIDNTIAVNITALTRLSRAALPGLLARGSGAIVNVGSVLAFHPWPEFGVYDAAKSYVVTFTQALQSEVKDKGVLVQLLVPPAVDTGFWNGAGFAVSNLPPAAVMQPDAFVAAALTGLDRGESVVLPSLGDVSLWQAFQDARSQLVGGLMNGQVADRYASATASLQ